MEKNGLPVPKPAAVVSILGKVLFIASFVLFSVAAARIVWLTLYFDMLVLLFGLSCFTLAASIVIKVIIRVKKGSTRAHRLINSGMKFSFFACIVIFFLFATFPTLARIVFWDDFNRCRSEIITIAEEVERYCMEQKGLPDHLSQLVDEGYLDSLPKFLGNNDYIYAVFERDSGNAFSIACPDPDVFSERRGIFSRGTKYFELEYIQDEGFIERKGRN